MSQANSGPVAPPNTAWATVQTSYDRNKFYVSSRGKDEGSSTYHVALPTTFVAQFHEARERCELPPQYRTVADLIRDAVAHRLHDVSQMSRSWELTDRMSQLLKINAELAQLNAEMAYQSETAGEIERALTKSRFDGDRKVFDEALAMAKRALKTLREPYKSKVRGFIFSQTQDPSIFEDSAD